MSRILSLKIWKAIQNPPRQHPLFKHVWRNETRRTPRLALIALCIVLIGYYAVQQHVTLLALISAVSAPLLLVLVGTGILIYITGLATTINHALHHVYEIRIYDLLCLTPPGRFGTTWAISAGSIHRRAAPETAYFVIRLVGALFIAVMLLGLVIVLLVILLGGFERWGDLFYPPALEFSRLLALALIFYLGSIQAAVGGILVGMLLPLYISDSTLSDLLTIGLFLCIEGAISFLAALLMLLVYPALMNPLNWLAGILQPFLGMLAFLLLHEAVNIALWRHLTTRLNSTSEPFQA